MDKQKILLIVGSFVALIVVLVVAYKLTNTPTSTYFPQTAKLKADDHYTWSPRKKNLLVEYSDLQCPACKAFHALLKTYEASNSANHSITQKVTLVYRFFPLYQIHQNTYASAYAAEAAGRQGKFFPMVDLLFDNQDSWASLSNPQDYFVGLAQKLGLNTNQFKSDMSSQSVKNRVDEDLNTGNQIGINATPTFFLNGAQLDIQSPEQFTQLLNDL